MDVSPSVLRCFGFSVSDSGKFSVRKRKIVSFDFGPMVTGCGRRRCRRKKFGKTKFSHIDNKTKKKKLNNKLYQKKAKKRKNSNSERKTFIRPEGVSKKPLTLPLTAEEIHNLYLGAGFRLQQQEQEQPSKTSSRGRSN